MLTNIAARTKFIFQLKYNINKLLNQSIISKKTTYSYFQFLLQYITKEQKLKKAKK